MKRKRIREALKAGAEYWKLPADWFKSMSVNCILDKEYPYVLIENDRGQKGMIDLTLANISKKDFDNIIVFGNTLAFKNKLVETEFNGRIIKGYDSLSPEYIWFNFEKVGKL